MAEPDPIPVDEYDGCDDCDLCCVLGVTDGTCPTFYWLCNCPGGVLTLQQAAFPSWIDFAVVDAGGTYQPSAIEAPLIGGSFRLRCELPSGEIYTSNEVLINPPIDRSCFCSAEAEAGAIKSARLYVEVEIVPFTRSDFGVDRVYGTPVTYSVSVDCGETDLIWSIGGAIQWELTAEYDPAFGSSPMQIYGKVLLQRILGDPLGAGGSMTLTMDYDDLVQGVECYWRCEDLPSFDGSASTHPARDIIVTPGVFSAWTSTGGSGFTFYYSAGYSVIIRSIYIETI